MSKERCLTITELQQFQIEATRKFSESICWDCANACTYCTWSEKFKPVKGWIAIPTKLNTNGIAYSSYNVKQCPNFLPDRPHKHGYKLTTNRIAKLLNTSTRNIFRWNVDTLNKKLKDLYTNVELTYHKDPEEEYGYFYIKINTQNIMFNTNNSYYEKSNSFICNGIVGFN